MGERPVARGKERVMDIFEAEIARRFVVAVEKIANALDRKDESQTSKIIEAYSRGFQDGAEAVKAVKIKALHEDHIEPYVTIEDEPQAGEMMTEEEFDSMLARVLTGNNEPQTERSE